MLTHVFTRIAAATFGGGLLAASLLVAPAANAVPGVDEPCGTYSDGITTTTVLSIDPDPAVQGETFTATADVTVSEGAAAGSVTFSYGGSDQTVPLTPTGASTGTASADFTAGSDTTITATYNGVCVGQVTPVNSSSDILGIYAVAGGGGDGGDGGDGGSNLGGLADTGLDTRTELMGLLGVGLLAVGGLTLMVHRRRVEG